MTPEFSNFMLPILEVTQNLDYWFYIGHTMYLGRRPNKPNLPTLYDTPLPLPSNPLVSHGRLGSLVSPASTKDDESTSGEDDGLGRDRPILSDRLAPLAKT